MKETQIRSLLKAISWRIVGSLDTFIISWVLTQKPLIASGIASVEVFTKIGLYWIHERVWSKVKI
jgi:uncharacterized membrane protein